MRFHLWQSVFTCGALCLPLVLQSAPPAAVATPTAPALTNAAAEAAWKELADAIPKPPSPGQQNARPPAPPDWTKIAAKAKALRQAHPNHPRAKEALGNEIFAEIQLGKANQTVAAAARARADQFANDPSQPIERRFEILAASRRAEIAHMLGSSRETVTNRQESHARELIAKFPQDIRGHGMLLQAATQQSGVKQFQVADEILKSNAPEPIKQRAQLIVRRHGLVGTQLQLSGVNLAAYRGEPLIVYTWTRNDGALTGRLMKVPKDSAIKFLGLNLDRAENRAAAQEVATKLPGGQIYVETDALPTVRDELGLYATGSITLIDGQGKVSQIDPDFETLRSSMVAGITAKTSSLVP